LIYPSRGLLGCDTEVHDVSEFGATVVLLQVKLLGVDPELKTSEKLSTANFQNTVMQNVPQIINEVQRRLTLV